MTHRLARTPGPVRDNRHVGRRRSVTRRTTPAVWRPHPAVLDEAVWWIDAEDGSAAGQTVGNRGWGVGLDATLGSTGGADTNDPLWLPPGGPGYVYIANDAYSLTVPDAAAFTPTTSLDFRIATTMDDWTPAATSYLGGQYASGGNQRAWRLIVGTTGFLQLAQDPTGSTVVSASSTVSLPSIGAVDGAILAVRAVWDSATPSVTFWWKATTPASAYADVVSDAGWTQIGTTVTGATVAASIFDSTAALGIAGTGGNGNSYTGIFYASVLKVDGVLQVGVNAATDCTSAAATSFTATTGQTVTVNRATSGRKTVVMPAGSRPLWLFGTDDYMEVADSDLLDFAAGDSFTVGVIGRQWATFGTNDALAAKKADTTNTTAGWLLGAGSTAAQIRLQAGDGTLGAEAVTGSRTSGVLYLAAGVRDVGADTLTGSLNATPGTPVTDATTATLANAETFRIGRLSGAGTEYSDTELLAAFIVRRALTAGELYEIARHYGAVA